MNTVFIDESGYTGRDLLNPEQPFMSLSAVWISNDAAARLRAKHFADVQAPELEHSSLSRRATYHRPLLAFQQECLSEYNGISFIVDKKYMCVLKMLDDCVEPVLHAQGIDFYDHGRHLALASLIYRIAPVFWGKNRLDELLRLYLSASANKTKKSIDELSDYARELEAMGLGEEISPIARKHPLFVEQLQRQDSSKDIAFSLLFGLLSKIEEYANAPYEVVHDRSPAMKRYHAFLGDLKDQGATCRLQISEFCRLDFPLQLSKVRDADSRVECGLQCADILAGGVIAGARVASGKEDGNEYNSNVLQQYSEHNLLFMLPNTDFNEVHRQFAGSQISQAIDYVTWCASRRNRDDI